MLKIPPQDIAVEKIVLGSMIVSETALNYALELIDNNKIFYNTTNQIVYNTIKELSDKNIKIDLLVINDYINKNYKLINSELILSELVDNISTTENIKSHVDILFKKYYLRKYLELANDINNMANTESEPDDIETMIDKSLMLNVDNKKLEVYTIQESMSQVFEESENNLKRKCCGITSGFKILDQYTGGFNPCDFIILAARPSVGKSALMINIATNVYIFNDKPVLIISLEMEHKSITRRIMAGLSGITSKKIQRGLLDDEQRSKIMEAANYISDYNIKIIDNPNLTVHKLRNIIIRLHKKYNFGIVMIDYLQLIQDSGKKDKRLETEEKSMVLKNLAKEIKIPIFCLSQLSRASEQRIDRRPRLSDLRESGAIEQDADLIMFLYRPFLAGEKDSKPENTELIIEKQRDGVIGTINLNFNPTITTFTDVKEEDTNYGENTEYFK